VTSGEEVTIRTPGDRIYIARVLQCLQVCTVLGIPELEGCVSSTASKHTAIRGKGHTDGVHMLSHPEQSRPRVGTVGVVPSTDPPRADPRWVGARHRTGASPVRPYSPYVPELDSAVPTSGRQDVLVSAESKGGYDVGVSLPGQMQGLALPMPDAHFPPPTTSGPPGAIATDGDSPDGIERLGQSRAADKRPGKIRILHLDTLQIGTTNSETREIQTPEMPTQYPQ
jgi:hypothetical protein